MHWIGYEDDLAICMALERLAHGMTFSVELGIYIPGKFELEHI